MPGAAELPPSSVETPSSLSHSPEQSDFLSTGLETPCSRHLSLESPSLSIPDWSRQTLRSLELLNSLRPSQIVPNCPYRSLFMWRLNSSIHSSLEFPISLRPSLEPTNETLKRPKLPLQL